MMKIIAGLVVQTKMNNGAINVVSQTNAFQNEIDASLKNITQQERKPMVIAYIASPFPF